MAPEIVYTPNHKIPICRRVRGSNGDRFVEFINTRTHRKELVKVSTLITMLLDDNAWGTV